MKAEKYAESRNSEPALIIVMKCRDNTTVQQIAKHLCPYARWFADLKCGRMNLSAILVIEDKEYLNSVGANEMMGSDSFNTRVTFVPIT